MKIGADLRPAQRYRHRGAGTGERTEPRDSGGDPVVAEIVEKDPAVVRARGHLDQIKIQVFFSHLRADPGIAGHWKNCSPFL